MQALRRSLAEMQTIILDKCQAAADAADYKVCVGPCRGPLHPLSRPACIPCAAAANGVLLARTLRLLPTCGMRGGGQQVCVRRQQVKMLVCIAAVRFRRMRGRGAGCVVAA